VIPGVNDSDDELTGIAAFIRSVGEEVPWHVTGFYPAYQMPDRAQTGTVTLRRARGIGLAEGVRYVYAGNIPGAGGENTRCYQCNALLIERYGFAVKQNRIRDAACPDCGTQVDAVGMSSA